MRKLPILIAISSLIIINSCKKEEKTSATENKEESKSSESFLGNLFGKSEAEYAIKKGKDGKYSFQLDLEEDETYKINSSSSNNQTISMNGQKMDGTDSQSSNMEVLVKEKKDSIYTLEVKITSISIKQKSQGKEFIIDTNAKMPTDEQTKMPWKVQKAMTNIPFTIELTNKGKVNKVSGVDAIYKNIQAELKKELKPEEMEMMSANLKQTINEEVLKKQFESGLNKFPNHSVSIGEAWGEENNKPEQGLKQKMTYKIDKIENDLMTISINGSINQNKEVSDSKSGMKQSISFKGSTKGQIIYDIKSGWIKSSTATESIKGKQSMTSLANNQTQSMEMSGTRVTKIN